MFCVRLVEYTKFQSVLNINSDRQTQEKKTCSHENRRYERHGDFFLEISCVLVRRDFISLVEKKKRANVRLFKFISKRLASMHLHNEPSGEEDSNGEQKNSELRIDGGIDWAYKATHVLNTESRLYIGYRLVQFAKEQSKS